ncbi:MAG: glycosyltransferase family 2 protein [Prosthecobacter sp.]
MNSSPALTFVFPCLNEERTLEACITAVRASLEPSGIPYEIVVADNGSTDRSREIATTLGCRLVPVAARGYGAALKGGIEAAAGTYVMFADSDSTYLYENAAELYQEAVKHDAGMAIASRMIGKIEPGAMPPLHRYLGTPVLTTLINRLFRGKLTDCNSGFRCIRKADFQRWDVRSDGMEFASELLIKALKADTKTVEIPSGLRPGPAGRVAHLRTWRDGMRHLLFILSEKPSLFEKSGLALALVATLLQLIARITGPVGIGPFHVFDLHSQALLLLGGILGTQLYVFGCSLFLRTADPQLKVTRKLITMDEGNLFFLLLAVLASCIALGAGLFITWSRSGFAGLHQTNDLLAAVHFLGVAATLSVGLLAVHTLKKAIPAPR